ncbi:MAG: acetamidase/formamidase family protein [Acidimicrobiia bacterium]|nr:acetamidase/formamidase family protein [Acidimicrobiia bacterium]MDH4305907.1 acetamidase/formamidase family protein [Acidimicrobiia bacterium]MDH5293019.1 acetamidase/formamidase family protein [Acidimicrobiia bacterium]
MVRHHLPAVADQLKWGAFSATFEPVIEIDSGDVVDVDTVHGSPGQFPDEYLSRLLPEHRELIENHRPILPGHIMTGPIGVRGAEPGDTLEIRVLDVRLRQDWAWNMIIPLRGSVPEDFPKKRVMGIELDAEAGVARMPWGAPIPLAPFFGVLGTLPPPEWGTIGSIAPQAHGGNLDIKELRPGSTLFLPVFNPGAGLMIGDGHAVQGDGESCLSAAETSMSGTFQLVVRKDLSLSMPRAETPTHHITIGIDADLDDAARQAIREMIGLIRELTDLSAEDAYTLCSLAADVRISQLVNVNKGCHMMLAKGALDF